MRIHANHEFVMSNVIVTPHIFRRTLVCKGLIRYITIPDTQYMLILSKKIVVFRFFSEFM